MSPRSPRTPFSSKALLVVAMMLCVLASGMPPAAAEAPFEPRPSVDQSDVGEITIGGDGALWSVESTSPLTVTRIDVTGAEERVPVAGVRGEPADLAAGLGTDPLWVAIGDQVLRLSTDGAASTVELPPGTLAAGLEPDGDGDRMWFVASDAQPADGGVVGTIDPSGNVTSQATTVPIYHDAELVTGPQGTLWARTGREVGELVRINTDLTVTRTDVSTNATGTPALGADGHLHVPAYGPQADPSVLRLRADGTVASSVPLPAPGGDAVAGPDGAMYLSTTRGYLRVPANGPARPVLDSPTEGPYTGPYAPGESVTFAGSLWYVGDSRPAGVLDVDGRRVPLVTAASEGAPGADDRVTISVSVDGEGSAVPSGTVSVVDLRCCPDGAAQLVPIGTATLDAAGRARITVSTDQYSTAFYVDYSGDNRFIGTTSVDIAYLDPGGAVGRYVNQVYADLLRRDPEQAGFDYWSVQLLDDAPRTAVAHALAISTEHRERLVEGLFSAYLDRSPEPAGRDSFVRDLARGATINQVRASILGSQEYFVRFGEATVEGYITALYDQVLARQPDEQGRAFWRNELAHGVSRPAMASALLSSQEALERLVAHDFDRLLRRPVDAGGRTYWADLLQRGFREERFIAELIGSDEYYASAVAGRY